MKQQSAVDFLVSKIWQNDIDVEPTPYYKRVIKLAKQIEKDQIINAQMYMFNALNELHYGSDYLKKRDETELLSEQYYNENFKNQL